MNGQVCFSLIQGKVNVILFNQVNRVIARKELEAARMCAELMLQVSNLLRYLACDIYNSLRLISINRCDNSLRYLACGVHFWSDSQVVLKWILNPDLHLPRFAKLRVGRIHLIASANPGKYVSTTLSPADVRARWENVKKAGISTWLESPSFLSHVGMESSTSDDIVVKQTGITANPLLVCANGSWTN